MAVVVVRVAAAEAGEKAVSWYHPQFRSMKSQPASAASFAACTPSSILRVAICAPKNCSLSPRTSRTCSTRLPARSCRANTISPTETSMPKSAQRRRKGRLPPFVSGARISFPRSRAASAAAVEGVIAGDTTPTLKNSGPGRGPRARRWSRTPWSSTFVRRARSIHGSNGGGSCQHDWHFKF